ncbi:hypothetical protein PM10SUCC1_08660 [Propionigenium maris DSM 9537]|uniref:DUF1858 domain-containing protein n=1 Tax=Propionigenium maris DSM 9537 TaxID=1123000 RepID=A0A9W6LM67_9FUSO|nr:DUF1858 domain-containing protein [Propionigenium maris]GLI55352.1 hypothetical protein PM10SUCC1_08660 [Propionigenium maris DSM 9537]
MIDENLLLEMNVQKIFKKYPFILEIFGNYGLKCRGCPFAEKVSLKEALKSSGLPSEEITQEIVRYLEDRSER